MDQKALFSHVQQFGSDWLKLVTESTTRLAEAAGVEKLEKQGLAQANAAVDEAGRLAKEALVAADQLSSAWRKVATEYAQRTLDLIAPKN